MFCHQCGTQVSNDLQFCPNCGASLAGAPSPATPLAPVPWTAPSGIRAQPGHWIGAGWDIVTQDFGMFMLLGLVFWALNTMVPIIIHGPLIAGLHIFCMKKLLGRRAVFADLFSGFNFFIPTLIASLLIALLVSVGFALCIIPGLILAAMYKFTYLFIVDKRMDFWQAMQASHAVVKNDYFGFTMFVLLLILVNFLGLLCLVIGLLITVPLSFAAITVAYRELVGFEQRTVDAL
jgi:hypothetical protein